VRAAREGGLLLPRRRRPALWEPSALTHSYYFFSLCVSKRYSSSITLTESPPFSQ
jgi:hypothetical protein